MTRPGSNPCTRDVEWLLCGECLNVAPSHQWDESEQDTSLCPKCGFLHRDDENSWIDAAWSEIEIHQKRREALKDNE